MHEDESILFQPLTGEGQVVLANGISYGTGHSWAHDVADPPGCSDNGDAQSLVAVIRYLRNDSLAGSEHA